MFHPHASKKNAQESEKRTIDNKGYAFMCDLIWAPQNKMSENKYPACDKQT
jgi:hypothetical protein